MHVLCTIRALGCLLYELATLHPPHHTCKSLVLLSQAVMPGLKENMRIPSKYSNALWNTIKYVFTSFQSMIAFYNIF